MAALLRLRTAQVSLWTRAMSPDVAWIARVLSLPPLDRIGTPVRRVAVSGGRSLSESRKLRPDPLRPERALSAVVGEETCLCWYPKPWPPTRQDSMTLGLPLLPFGPQFSQTKNKVSLAMLTSGNTL